MASVMLVVVMDTRIASYDMWTDREYKIRSGANNSVFSDGVQVACSGNPSATPECVTKRASL
mgnify:CR=1 FL=1